jgi:hypothetical protein
MRPLRLGLTATAAAAAFVLAACSSSGTTDGSGSAAPAGSTPTVSSSAPSSPATPSTSSAAAPSSASPSATASATGALAAETLAAADVPGFHNVAPDTSISSLPCTPKDKPLETQFPPQARGDVEFDSTSGNSTFDETVYRYDAATAAKFFTAGEKGFACTSGTVGTEQFKIVPVGPVDTAGKADQAQRWDLAFSDNTFGTAILARKGGTIIGMTFQATTAGQSEILPDTVLDKALAKIS